MSDRTTPPHVDEIPWGDPAPHPVDILAMTPDLALAEAYRQTRQYRIMLRQALAMVARLTEQNRALQARLRERQ